MFVESRHGGHCAFLGRDSGDDIHWAEAAVLRFLQLAVSASPAMAAASAPSAAAQLQ
jgi:predicted alpha/beta-fold hydrolase